MGVHFIRLTDVQVAYLHDVLVDWQGEFEGIGETQECCNYIETLRGDLFNMPTDSIAWYKPANADTNYPEPEDIALAYYPPDPKDIRGESLDFVMADEFDESGFAKLIDKVIEVNGWFS